MYRKALLTLALVFFLGNALHAEQDQGFYSKPSIHEDKIVFSSDGSLWKVLSSGGVAKRLTSDVDYPTSPVISPDGKWVAYSSYRGQNKRMADIYIIPIEGGLPKRLTFGEIHAKAVSWLYANEVIYKTLSNSGYTESQ